MAVTRINEKQIKSIYSILNSESENELDWGIKIITNYYNSNQ